MCLYHMSAVFNTLTSMHNRTPEYVPSSGDEKEKMVVAKDTQAGSAAGTPKKRCENLIHYVFITFNLYHQSLYQTSHVIKG